MCVRNFKISLDDIPTQGPISNIAFSYDGSELISQEVYKFLSKGIIEVAEHCQGAIISNIFTIN